MSNQHQQLTMTVVVDLITADMSFDGFRLSAAEQIHASVFLNFERPNPELRLLD